MFKPEEIKNLGVGHIVSLSGGADSATVMGLAVSEYRTQIEKGIKSFIKAFHCNYGQRTEARELKAFNNICDFYGIPDSDRIIVDMSFLKQIGASSLTDKSIEVDTSGESLVKDKIPTSFVPGRNIIFLSMCSSVAAIHGASDIWIGVVEEDSSGYPDCRASFIESMQSAINDGMPDGVDFKIRSPLLYAKKSEIIEKGLSIGVPYSLSWSCYSCEDEACGECDSCKLRIRSFVKLGMKDPIKYKKSWEEILEDYKTWGID